MKRPTQADGLLAKKGGRAAAKQPPVSRRKKSPTPPPKKSAQKQHTEVKGKGRQQSNADKEVEDTLREVYEVYGGSTMSYEDYLKLLRQLKVLENVKNPRAILDKTRPPPGRKVQWEDFQICLRILAINKYSTTAPEEAIERLILELVTEWVSLNIDPPPSTNQSTINGVLHQSTLPLPDDDDDDDDDSDKYEDNGNYEQHYSHSPEEELFSDNDIGSPQRNVPLVGDVHFSILLSHYTSLQLSGSERFVTCMNTLLGTHPRLSTDICQKIFEIHFSNIDDNQIPTAFTSAFNDIACQLFPSNRKEVAGEMALQIALGAVNKPSGVFDILLNESDTHQLLSVLED